MGGPFLAVTGLALYNSSMRKTLFLVFLCGASLVTHVARGEGSHSAPSNNAAHTTGTRPFVDGPHAPSAVEMSFFENDAESTEGLEKRILDNLQRMNGEARCPSEPSAAYEPCTGTKPVGEFGKDEDVSSL
jgi:hypothetical protein